MKKYILALATFTFLFLQSCVDEPYNPTEVPDVNDTSMVAIVLNEGLFNSNESSLSAIYMDDYGYIVDNSFSPKDGTQLGDLGNSMVKYEDKLYVIIGNSSLMSEIDIDSGEKLREYIFEDSDNPRSAVVANGSIFVTLGNTDKVVEIDLQSLTKVREFETGPAPENIGYHMGYLYVANSALGVFRKDEANAWTISKIDINSGTTEYFETGINPVHISIQSNTGTMYVGHQDTSWTDVNRESPAFVGGLIQYDLNDMSITKEWKTNPRGIDFNFVRGDAYMITELGLEYIDLTSSGNSVELLYTAEAGSYLYGVGINPNKEEVWMLDAKDFSSEGSVHIYDRATSKVTNSLTVGKLPKDIIFK